MRYYIARSLVSMEANETTLASNLEPVCGYCGDEVDVLFKLSGIDATHISDGTPICEAID